MFKINTLMPVCLTVWLFWKNKFMWWYSWCFRLYWIYLQIKEW